MSTLKFFLVLTDTVILAYWLITYFHLIPVDLLFQDYTNKYVVNWNWSFLGIDLVFAFLGYISLYFYKIQKPIWRDLALISLVLTSASGFMAISYWIVARDFNLLWWSPNLYLLIYPWFFIIGLMKYNKFNYLKV